MTAYELGFIHRCSELGFDGKSMLKTAQDAGEWTYKGKKPSRYSSQIPAFPFYDGEPEDLLNKRIDDAVAGRSRVMQYFHDRRDAPDHPNSYLLSNEAPDAPDGDRPAWWRFAARRNWDEANERRQRYLRQQQTGMVGDRLARVNRYWNEIAVPTRLMYGGEDAMAGTDKWRADYPLDVSAVPYTDDEMQSKTSKGYSKGDGVVRIRGGQSPARTDSTFLHETVHDANMDNLSSPRKTHAAPERQQSAAHGALAFTEAAMKDNYQEANRRMAARMEEMTTANEKRLRDWTDNGEPGFDEYQRTVAEAPDSRMYETWDWQANGYDRYAADNRMRFLGYGASVNRMNSANDEYLRLKDVDPEKAKEKLDEYWAERRRVIQSVIDAEKTRRMLLEADSGRRGPAVKSAGILERTRHARRLDPVSSKLAQRP